MKNSEDSLRDIKHTVTCITGVQEAGREKQAESLFQEIMAENFPNQGKETDI